MTKLKNFYEKFWSENRGEFEKYVRNIELANFFEKGETVLDVGCGDGTVGLFLQEAGVKITGIDISEQAVKKAREKGIDAKLASSEQKFPFESNSFDKVFWGDNAEHLFDPASALGEIRRVLKKSGKLIMSCPNMGYWRYRIKYFLNGSLPDTEWTGLNPWEWSHIRFFNLKILEKFLLLNGFNKITKVLGVSERRLDKPFLKINPSLFGMILILEAE
jgi:methionine biosynthesis protein MetW